MINFRQIELSDREWIDPIFQKAGLMGCEYTFVNNYIWSTQYKLEIAYVEGFYCTRSGLEIMEYGFPIGEGDLKKVMEMLVQDAKDRGEAFIMHALMSEHVTLLDLVMPGQFEYTTTKDDSDYIYSTEKLIDLSGKKLHGKRNHIARFKDNNWSYETISDENINDCIEMNKKWCEKNECLQSESLQQEACAVRRSLSKFKELQLVGGLLRIDGEVVAFTFGEPLNSNTFVVHVEKAYSEIQGAYPMINQQFVIHECQEYEFVNREEDMGDEGLRKAKMSYYPEIVLDKYRAIYKA
jgi:hypothetical protein